MKKNILMLINGFGIEKANSYSVYSGELMPNLEGIRTTKIFKTITNNFLDYKSAYRNFSMGIDDALTYNLIDNNIFKVEYPDNPFIKYIIQEMNKNEKIKLHIFVYWDSVRTVEQLSVYVKELQSKMSNKIYIHVILCQTALEDYKYIERGFNVLNYELGMNVKIGLVAGEDLLNDNLQYKDVMKTFITEYGEKWKDLNKKLEVQIQTKMVPRKTRTFAVSYGFGITEGDKVLFFNYSNVDVTNIRKELIEQKYRKFNESTIQYFSLFPVKCDVQIPFMYNYAVASSYTLNSLKTINAKCIVFDKKDKCPFINYYLTGLKNDVDPDLKYMPTDDGFIYNKDLLIQNIDAHKDKDLIIINYDISDVKDIQELKARLKSIDEIVGVLHNYVVQNKYALTISSMYGFERDMYNEKSELCSVNFSGKVPFILDDETIVAANYNIVDNGNMHDLCDTLLKNISKDYKGEGLLRKKSALLSFLYKKPSK
jgi:bisphosphoglycerate-independent phosphoglycerate mutase (AlkP superfamily)